METKICSKCGIKKPITEFRNKWYSKYNKYYLYSHCKECEKNYDNKNGKENKKRYYERHKDEVKERSKKQRENNHEAYINYLKNYYQEHREERKIYDKDYAKANKIRISRYQKKYYEKNLKEKKKYDKQYFEKNRAKIYQRIRNKYDTDEMYRFKLKVRNTIRMSFRRKGQYKNKRTEEILGCTFKELYQYLLDSYRKNYGTEWNGIDEVHIDHIIPLSTVKIEEEIIKLCHYTNLQLLKAKDNLSKNDKLNWKLEK